MTGYHSKNYYNQVLSFGKILYFIKVFGGATKYTPSMKNIWSIEKCWKAACKNFQICEIHVKGE